MIFIFIDVEFCLRNFDIFPSYKYPEEVKILESRLMINSYRKGWKEIIDSGDFKIKYCTKEAIYKMIEPYRLERNINKYLDKQNGIL